MPVPWSTPAPLVRLTMIAEDLAGIQAVVVGVPESAPAKVFAYITAGGQTYYHKSGRLMQRTLSYRVVLCYVVEGAEADAEMTIMIALDELVAALFADMTLNGTLQSVDVDATEADRPEYSRFSEQETREYPVRITGMQQIVPSST